jgi:hypothetical protein
MHDRITPTPAQQSVASTSAPYVIGEATHEVPLPVRLSASPIVRQLLNLAPGESFPVSGASYTTVKHKVMAVRRAHKLPPRCFIARDMGEGVTRIWRRGAE